ncbi:hypothetical protein EV426DRAFT_705488 [Tirmania nivea]|nr:hypothetical protein EV426DRAFT_705488 [Tirmania nivea]
MEVLGATASIVQLVTVAGQVVSEVRRYSKSLKNCPRTAEQLLQQLETMQRVLGDLSTMITPTQMQIQTTGVPQRDADTSNLQHLIGNSVKTCEQSLQEIHDKIQAMETNKPASTNRLKRWTSTFSKRLLWPFTEEETKELIASLGTHERQFLIAMNAATFRKVNVVEEHAQAEKLRLLRKWISNIEYTSKYSRSIAVRNRKTGSWLLNNPMFKNWMAGGGNSQIFWLNGIAGCGKTMLTSMVIEHIIPADPDCVGTYFYCDRTDATFTNVGNILRSLLAQLLFYNPTKTEPLIARLQAIRLTGANLPSHPSQLQDYIVEAATYYTEAIIVLDAVDECHKNAREDLLVCLVYIVGQVSSLRLFMSSRDETDIRENLIPPAIDFSLGEVSASSSLHEDIKIYIQDEFDRKPRLKRLRSDLKLQISDKILGSHDKMFRWVQCQVDNIVKCRSEEDIHEILTNLPVSLNQTKTHLLVAHKGKLASKIV